MCIMIFIVMYKAKVLYIIFRFPKDEDKRVHWFTAIGKKVKNFIFTFNSQICSQHFTMECFVITCSGKRYLKTDAVPSIFNIPLKQGLELVQPVCILFLI